MFLAIGSRAALADGLRTTLYLMGFKVLYR